MAFGSWIVAFKTVLDLVAAGAFAAGLNPKMAVMFFTFVLVDLATLWVSL